MRAYQAAAAALSPDDLTRHYTDGLDAFHERFVPHLQARLRALTGGAWDLSDHVAYAAGSDVDLMTHVVEAIAAREPVHLYPGGWWGFRVGSTFPERFRWDADATGRLACLCVPSVRNGHLTEPMAAFLESADTCLLNLNLFPTLTPADRQAVARRLAPVLPRSLLSISFSRGFGLTASQLGVMLVPREHPWRARFDGPWSWLTYFHNALAARAFEAFDEAARQAVDDARRAWVEAWLEARGLPVVAGGSYYVRSFRVEGEVPEALRPLVRDDVVRLCLKPPVV